MTRARLRRLAFPLGLFATIAMLWLGENTSPLGVMTLSRLDAIPLGAIAFVGVFALTLWWAS